MEKLMSAQQVAEHLGMHVKTLYRLLRDNQIALPFIRKHGRMIGFRPSDVLTYVDTHRVNRDGTSPIKPHKPRKPRPGFLSDEETWVLFQGTPMWEKFSGQEEEDYLSGKRTKESFPSDYFHK